MMKQRTFQACSLKHSVKKGMFSVWGKFNSFKLDRWGVLSFCHWNLNTLSVHNYVNLSSLQAYNKHDVICLSETYLDNSVLSDESDLNFPGYKLVTADYPGNVKRRGVCIYFKESLSIRFLDVPSNLNECLLCELNYRNKKCFIATLCCSPSQSREEF